jgi:hypothetical protein
VNNKKNKILLLPKFTVSCLLLALLHYSTNAQDNTEVTSKTINEINNQNIRAFMEEELECDQYVFPPGDFPKIKWKNEVAVENEIGKFPLEVKFFKSDFQQVATADKPGRYGALIEGVTPSGFTI